MDRRHHIAVLLVLVLLAAGSYMARGSSGNAPAASRNPGCSQPVKLEGEDGAVFRCEGLAPATQPLRLTGVEARMFFEKLELNAADGKDLEGLRGVGPHLSRRIQEYRRTHGDFQNTRQLLDVRGIGPRTLEKLDRWVTVKATKLKDK